MKVLALDYKKIHACAKDYILYKNEFKNVANKRNRSKKLRKRVPKKVL